MKKILTLFIILMIIPSANAETGDIYISSDIINSWTNSGVGADCNAAPFTQFAFDTSDYNHVVGYIVNLTSSDTTFPKAADSTTFTITSGGTGGGTAWYYGGATRQIRWQFTPDSIITSSPFAVTYSYNIFAGMTHVKEDGFDAVVDSTHPIRVTCTFGAGQKRLEATEQGFTSVSTHEHYNVTYPLAGKALVNITKAQGTVGIKNYVNSQTITYFNESTYNFNNVSGMIDYADGLYINATISAGGYTIGVINQTGTVQPTPSITATINPAYGTGIAWGKTNYSLGETGTLSWIIDGSVFDFISDFNIKITDQNGAIVKEFHNLGATGNAQYQFPAVGVYTASFYKSICVLGICSNDFKGSSSASVSLSPSYIFITSPVISGVSFNTSYIFGNTVINQGELNSVIIEQFTDGGLSAYSTTSLNNFNIVAGTSYNVSLIVGSPGKYKATLFDVSRGRIADVNFDAVVGFIPPQANITSSYVTTDKLAYFFSESIIASYAIDNVNYTNGSLSKYFAIKNNDKNLYVFITPNSIGWPLTEQVDTFEVPINSGSEDVPCQTNKNCFKFNSNTIFYPGSTSIELHAKTNNTDTILAFGNFTINQIDSDGYGLFLSKSNTCVNDPVVITVSSPINSTVQIIEHSNSADNIVFSEWSSSGNNKTTTRRFFHTGTYEVNLIDQSANTRFNRYINVNSKYCTVAPTPTSPPVTASGTTSQITNFLTSNRFWALVMIVGFMLAIAYKERKGN